MTEDTEVWDDLFRQKMQQEVPAPLPEDVARSIWRKITERQRQRVVQLLWPLAAAACMLGLMYTSGPFTPQQHNPATLTQQLPASQQQDTNGCTEMLKNTAVTPLKKKLPGRSNTRMLVETPVLVPTYQAPENIVTQYGSLENLALLPLKNQEITSKNTIPDIQVPLKAAGATVLILPVLPTKQQRTQRSGLAGVLQVLKNVARRGTIDWEPAEMPAATLTVQ